MEFRNAFEGYGRTLSLDEKIKMTEDIMEPKDDNLSMEQLRPLFEKLALQHETLIKQNNQIIQLLQKIVVR